MKPEEAIDKLQRVKGIIQAWTDQQGHERCWYYPDLFNELASLLGVIPKTEPCLPPRKEFEEGCRRYQEQEYGQRTSLPTVPSSEED
jgi:hypothetical protein